MKIIKTMADVSALKADERLPSFYIEEIYNQFLGTYEAVAENEEIDDFSLAPNACIYHFNKESDLEMLVRLTGNIEYVDVEIVDGIKFFRIGIMQEHEISILYFLENTLPYKTEKWLEN